MFIVKNVFIDCMFSNESLKNWVIIPQISLVFFSNKIPNSLIALKKKLIYSVNIFRKKNRSIHRIRSESFFCLKYLPNLSQSSNWTHTSLQWLTHWQRTINIRHELYSDYILPVQQGYIHFLHLFIFFSLLAIKAFRCFHYKFVHLSRSVTTSSLSVLSTVFMFSYALDVTIAIVAYSVVSSPEALIPADLSVSIFQTWSLILPSTRRT